MLDSAGRKVAQTGCEGAEHRTTLPAPASGKSHFPIGTRGGPYRRQVSARDSRRGEAGPLQPRRPGILPPSAPRGTARYGSCPAPVPVSRAGSSRRRQSDAGVPVPAIPTGHTVTTATGGRTARGPFKGTGGSRRAAPHGAAARGSHVGGTWRPLIGPPAPARCNQLLLGRRAGNGLKGAAQLRASPRGAAAAAPGVPARQWVSASGRAGPGRRSAVLSPAGTRGRRGPFKEVVQSSRGAAKSSGSAEFLRPRPPRPPIGARGERSLLIGRGLRATSRNRGCVTSPGTGRRRPRAGGGGRAVPAAAPRPVRGPRKGRAPSEPPCPRRPFTRLKMPTHSTRGTPGAPLRTTIPGVPRDGVAPSVPKATAARPGGNQALPRGMGGAERRPHHPIG
ncbi:collagen alpha-1(I) chain-like [Pyrgilauda ruficollis]|uniref:collagen alpha-1(I) chain-like n=1 Tax=Pyrgilauda ruficollis TaxID=221976 RepID=UPI001B85F387|nr:collagen alpha-1(I) chain-like [Pyrgilauda ruficollis]